MHFSYLKYIFGLKFKAKTMIKDFLKISCITVPNGIICISKTEFNCPSCGKLYTEKDYYSQLDKSKRGLIYKRCKCGIRIGITSDIRGDIRAWDKGTELTTK